MENIDDLMRQKFDSDDPGARFEFQEEYWEQAQVLLEQQEQKKRRAIWLLLALLLALGVTLWLLLGQGWGGHFSKNGATGDPSTTMLNEDKSAKSSDLIRKSEVSSEQNNAGVSNAAPSNQAGKTATNAQNSNSTTFNTNQANTGKRLSKSTHKGGNQKTGTLNSKKARAKFDRYGDANARFGETQTRVSDSGNQDSNQSGNLVFTPATQNGLNNNPDGNTATSQSSDNQGDQAAIPINAQSTNRSNLQFLYTPISILPTPLFLFELPVRVLETPKLLAPPAAPIAEKDKSKGEKRLSLGFLLAGSANTPDSNGRWAGWTAGVFGDYRLNENWSLGLGAQWRFLPGYGALSQNPDTTNAEFTEQLRYSFGFERETWETKIKGLHYLEIPVSARWMKGRLGIEGGAAAGMLLAVQNQIEHTTESSLVAAKTTISKFVKGDQSLFKRTYFTALAGIQYNINPRLAVLARGQYRFTPIYNNGLDHKGLACFDLGLKLRLY